MTNLPVAIILNVGLIVFVAWAIIWLITRTPPSTGEHA